MLVAEEWIGFIIVKVRPQGVQDVDPCYIQKVMQNGYVIQIILHVHCFDYSVVFSISLIFSFSFYRIIHFQGNEKDDQDHI